MLVLLLLCLATITEAGMVPDIVYEWKSVEFDWPSASTKSDYLKSKKYIPNNNIITGIKVWKSTVFVTVPRWRPGVPVTLAALNNATTPPTLTAWPSWDIQQTGDCNNIIYTQSMTIDSKGTMWAIDAGLTNNFSPSGANTTCPPKILLIDIETKQVTANFTLPPTVAPPGTFLNDIVIDEANGLAFISDTGLGSLITVDMSNPLAPKAYRFKHPSMDPSPLYNSIWFDGFLFNLSAPIDGIAISADKKLIYYNAVTSRSLHSVAAAALTQGSRAAAETVTNLGLRPSWTDGMICSDNGRLFYAAQADYAIYMWNTSAPLVTRNTQMEMYFNNMTMQWTDTFAIADNTLWWTTNKLPLFVLGRMDFSQVNMRIFKMSLNMV